ncbi:MAG: FprA family A-type flavoprotein, partial [Bacteroidales bacterium]|nr:FprA family A-type flavoprotein [Bacteroidales bacterium]
IKEEIGDRKIDYLVVNHMEPDHSSSIAAIRGLYPDITMVSTALAVPMIKGYYGVEGNILTVKDGDTVSLGGSTLAFYATPMVHWPETMMTYLVEEKTIFSGDAFGSFGAVEGGIIDSEAGLGGWLGERKECFEAFRDEMTRYYSNIVGKYGAQVQAAFRKLSALEIKRICSTHGPVWESQAGKVVALYESLSRYEAERGVCIVYGSMYGNTAQAALSLAAELAKKGVRYAIHDLCSEDVSFAYRDLFRYDTLAVGSPTYNNDIYPPVYSFMYGVCSRLVKNRRFIAFGSYTWAGASVRKLNEMAEKQSFQLLGEGLPFPHAFSKEKCDMAAVASLIAE